MKALLILLLAAFIFMGCNISANPDTVSLKLDSAIEQVRQLNISLKAEDSIELLLTN
jgi:PBP1b-binding outer membrane lipoprotein LpoB